MIPIRALRLIIACTLLWSICSCGPSRSLSRVEKAPDFSADSSLAALCATVSSIALVYVDETGKETHTAMRDSFYIGAANGLIGYEVSQRFSMCRHRGESLSTNPPVAVASPAVAVTDLPADSSERAAWIKQLCSRHDAHLVVVPSRCVISQVAIKPKGWRQGKYGPYYEKPLSYKAIARVDVHIYDRGGRCLFCATGMGDTGRPVHFSLLGQRHAASQINDHTGRFNAPLLVKALHGAIADAFSSL